MPPGVGLGNIHAKKRYISPKNKTLLATAQHQKAARRTKLNHYLHSGTPITCYNNTTSVPNYKSFQESWRVKSSQNLTKIIKRNIKIYNIK